MRRSSKIILALFIIIVLGALAFFLWPEGEPAPEIPSGGAPAGGVLPQSSETPSLGTSSGNTSSDTSLPSAQTGIATGPSRTLLRLSDVPVFDFWVHSDARNAYYLSSAGEVLIAQEGNDLTASPQTFSALNSLTPNRNGDRALVAFGNPTSPQWGIFDAIDKAWRPLPAGIITAAWGVGDTELIAIASSSGSGPALQIMDVSKNPPTRRILLPDFRFLDVTLSFIPPSSLYLTERPVASYPSRIWLLDTRTLAVNTIIQGDTSLAVRWSDDLKNAFFGNASTFRIYTNPNLTGALPVPFYTIPGKCAGETPTVACFVPFTTDDIPANSSLLDATLMHKAFFDDTLYLADSVAESLEQIIISEYNDGKPIDAKNPRMAGEYVYFINAIDGFLYRFSIR